MKVQRLVLAAAAMLAFSMTIQAAGLGYTLDVTTEYLEPGPPVGPTFLGCCTGAPDTSYFVITNNGTTTFTGTIGATAVDGGGTDHSQSFGSQTLAPGQSVSVSVTDESSNVGGFGGTTGTTQTGVTITLTGLINGSEAVGLSVNDADIHSGVPQLDPFGNTTDSYVLQGGDPLGNDTGDGFELAQAFGHFEFFEATTATPEPGAFILFGTVLASLGLRKKFIAGR